MGSLCSSDNNTRTHAITLLQSPNHEQWADFLSLVKNPTENKMVVILVLSDEERKELIKETSLGAYVTVENPKESVPPVEASGPPDPQIQINPKQNAALGAILGAFLGDSIGSYLEFKPSVTEGEAVTALKMPGGGCFNVSPGQVTDDSELALSLGYGLIKGEGQLNLDQIAYYYGFWMNSSPFDMGGTTSTGLQGLGIAQQNMRATERDVDGLARNHAFTDALQKNGNSLSNGGLMRLTPMCIWARNLCEQDLERAIGIEQSFTHSNHIAHLGAITYAMAIGHLINNPKDSAGALKKVDDYIQSKQPSFHVDEIVRWWGSAKSKNAQLMPATDNIGFMKIAWTYSFIFLKRISAQGNDYDYLKVIKEVIKAGGDTDTNACIVGGMVGAYFGYDLLPKNQLDILLKLDASQAARKRPSIYSPGNAKKMALKLFDLSPKNLDGLPDNTLLTRQICGECMKSGAKSEEGVK